MNSASIDSFFKVLKFMNVAKDTFKDPIEPTIYVRLLKQMLTIATPTE